MRGRHWVSYFYNISYRWTLKNLGEREDGSKYTIHRLSSISLVVECMYSVSMQMIIYTWTICTLVVIFVSVIFRLYRLLFYLAFSYKTCDSHTFSLSTSPLYFLRWERHSRWSRVMHSKRTNKSNQLRQKTYIYMWHFLSLSLF